MNKRQAIVVEIALQTQVLKTCPVHHQLFLDDEVSPAPAFALALELMRHREPYVAAFDHDIRALTEVLSDTLGIAPDACPECACNPPHGVGTHQKPRLVTAARATRLAVH